MSNKVASTESTGGKGGVFEKQVDAYLLACLLIGKTPLEEELGVISNIEFQTLNKGWFLDDILLTLDSKDGPRKLALSVTSNKNRQFKIKSAPKDFVEDAWKQYLGEGKATQVDFDKNLDLLGLICLSVPEDVELLLKYVRERHSEWSYEESNKNQQAFFDSFACPNTEFVQKYNLSEDDTVKFLKCIRVYDFDFNKPVSRWKKKALVYCRDALRDEERADDLWNELLRIADEYRPAGGYLKRMKLVDLLRWKFRLKEFPEYRLPWEYLKAHTDENLNRIRDTIGGKITLQRPKELEQLEDSFKESKAVVLLGPPGCGKTVLAKLFAKSKPKDGRVVWLEKRDLKDVNFNSMKSKLNYPLKEILASTTPHAAYMIIDKLDRTYDEDEDVLRNMSLLMAALKLDTENSSWRVLITCQVDEWNRLSRRFESVNLIHPWHPLRIGVPAASELNAVWAAFPQLGYLRQRFELQDLLLKPKILDLMASNLSSSKSIDIAGWVGESDLIEWFWKEVVSKGSEGQIRAGFLRRLAARQADDLRTETPLDNTFPDSELSVIDSLRKDGICRLDDERVSFDHPLYGDWIRQRILVGQTSNLKQYLKDRITSPLWQRAVRLYGLHLLEQQGVSEWKSVFDLFDTEEEKTIQRLLIDSVIFAANPRRFLDNLWPTLKADEGKLLHRLLRTFLYEATQANPLVLKSAREWGIDSETVAATIQRIPWIPYWRPMLRFLHEHLVEILEIDFVQICVVTIAYAWLTLPFPELDLRKEAAELALSIAEKARQKVREGVSISEELREALYKAAPAAVGDLPGRFTRFALETSGRIAPIREGEVRKRRMTDPWPDGPKRRPDSAFQKICLVGYDLNQTILSNPELAQRLILALLIKPPQEIDDYLRSTPLPIAEDICQIQDDGRWPPPSFGWGPFLYFLENKPVEGLEVIIRLVNFATQRWSDSFKDKEEAQRLVRITLPTGERELLGNVNVYHWYRDNGDAPGPLASALMALEKWLYDKVDKGESINDIINKILQDAGSVAFAGVLSALGRKETQLFRGPLKNLLAIPEFLYWESPRYRLLGSLRPSMYRWLDYGKQIFNKIQKWHTMSHREKGLDVWAFELFGQDITIRTAITEAREEWIGRLEKEKDEGLKGYLQNLVFWFDLTNWKEDKSAKDKSQLIFEMPEETRAEIQSSLKVREERDTLMTFPYLCRDALKSNRPLPEENLEEFWAFLQSITDRVRKVGVPLEIAPLDDLLCGGAAVLVVLHGDWLNNYPERKKWCVDQILQTFKKFYPPRRPDSDISWDKFCAHAIPKVWVENPNSIELRKAVALLASDRNYSTVGSLIGSAAHYREKLGKHFKQLQHFILRWASVRFWRDMSLRFLQESPGEPINITLFDRLRYVFVPWDKPYVRAKDFRKSLIDSQLWLIRGRGAFVKEFISEQLPTLEEVIVKRPPRDKKLPYRVIKGLDLTLIQVAYNWLPPLEQALDEQERKKWIEFWKEALSYTIDIFINTPEDRRDRIFPIREWKRWLLEHIASLIIQLKPEESPGDFWKSILELGAPAHDFIEDFLQEWFRQNIKSGLVPKGFTREWRTMIEFAFSSPKWDFASMEKWYDLDTLWCNLMGFGFPGMLTDISRDIWEKGPKELITGMKDLYQRWAEKFLQRPRCALSFVLFLERPAAEPLLFDGLLRFEKAASQADETYWGKRDLIEAVALLLKHCWEHHWEKIQQDRETLNAYAKLVNKLAGYGNPIAMEIQSKMGRRRT